MWGLSQAQGALYDLGCGLLTPISGEGAPSWQNAFSSQTPTPTLVSYPPPSQSLGSLYPVLLSSSVEVRRRSNVRAGSLGSLAARGMGIPEGGARLFTVQAHPVVWSLGLPRTSGQHTPVCLLNVSSLFSPLARSIG